MKRMQKIVFLAVISFCLGGWFIQESQAQNVYNLKGTLSVLPPVLQELSVLHGAIAFETGMVRRLYEDGPLSKEPEGRPERPPESAGEDAKKEYKNKMIDYNKQYGEWLRTREPAVQLVRSFFYLVPGSSLLRLPEMFETIDQIKFAQAMGVLIASMWWYMWSVANGVGSKSAFEGFLKNDAIEIFGKTLSLDGFDQKVILRSVRDTQWGNTLPLLVVLAAVWFKCGNDIDALKVYYKALVDTVRQKLEYSRKLLQGAQRANQKRLDDQTISEEDRKNAEEKEKKYQEVHEKIESIVHNLPRWSSPDDWHKEEFVLTEKAAIEKEIAGLTCQDLQITRVMAAQNYEKLVFSCFGPMAYPKDISHLRDFTFKDKEGTFADCFETAIRSLINHLAYNPETYDFSLDCLKELLRGKDPLQAVQTFYTKHKNPSFMSEKQVHGDWLPIISGIPWAIYYCGGVAKVLIPNEISAEDRVQCCEFYKKKYSCTVVDSAKTFFYELVPNYRNFIVVMNYLLNLGLFDGKNMAREICRDDFIRTYLPKVFECLYLIELDMTNVSFRTLDELDSTYGCGSYLIIKKLENPSRKKSRAYAMRFRIDIGAHGELVILDSDKKSHSVPDPYWAEDIHALPYTFLMLVPFKDYQESFKNGNQDVGAFWAHMIADSERILALMGYDPQFMLSNESYKISAPMVNILLTLASKIEDERTKIKIILCIYATVVRSGLSAYHRQAFEKAHECMKFGDYMIDNMIIKLFNLLLDRGHDSGEAFAVADIELKSENKNTRYLALALFEVLINRGYAFLDAAIIAAEIAMNDEFLLVRNKAVGLFACLFDKDRGFVEAIRAAQKCMGNKDNREQQGDRAEKQKAADESKRLLIERLRNEGKSLELSAFTLRRITSYTVIDGYQDSALTLFTSLVMKGYGYKEAIAAAIEGVFCENCNRDRVVGLFEVLFKKKEGIQEAISVAKDALIKGDDATKAIALSLFIKLVHNGYGFEEAVAAIKTSKILDIELSENLVDSIVDLFFNLIDRGYGAEDAIVWAKKIADSKFCFKIIRLLEKLSLKGFTEATELLKSKKLSEYPSALQTLLQSLVH